MIYTYVDQNGSGVGTMQSESAGWNYNYGATLSWADLMAANGNYTSVGNQTVFYLQANAAESFQQIVYNYFFISTWDLAGKTIKNASLFLYLFAYFSWGSFAPNLALFGFTNPASQHPYDTRQPTILSDEILFADLTADGWKEFKLNAAGLAYISKTSGVPTYIGVRCHYDYNNIDPSAGSLGGAFTRKGINDAGYQSYFQVETASPASGYSIAPAAKILRMV
jgi:hypothetical protein